MEYGSLLLLFDAENPCWTAELLSLAGEDPTSLVALKRDGLLTSESDVFFLTESGREAFRSEAVKSWLTAEPGRTARCDDALFRTRLRLLLDTRHIQRWGVKEYFPSARFPIPALTDEELFTWTPSFHWLWPDHDIIRKMRQERPNFGLAARKEVPPAPGTAEQWLEAQRRTSFFEVDLLHLSRYDFQAYAHIPRPPADLWGLSNADRFFCIRAPTQEPTNIDAFLTVTGRFQLSLEVLRRMILPGYVDHDSMDQDCINWLLFIFEHDAEAETCRSLLSPFGLDLIQSSMPMDVWTLSLEALTRSPGKAETIHDLIPFVGRAVVRTP